MELDWRVASVLFMAVVGAYNVVLKKFLQSEDWRTVIPFLVIGVALLGAYFLSVRNDVKFSQNSALFALGILAMSGLVVALSTYIFAHPKTELSIAVPIMGLSAGVTVVLAVMFLGEAVSIKIIAGVVLGIVSIALLVWK